MGREGLGGSMKKFLLFIICLFVMGSSAFAYLQSDSLKIKDDEGEVATLDGSFSANRAITVPDETGTMCTTGSVCTGYQATITEGSLPNDSVLEADLKAVDAASDEECLTYETTTGDFEWQSCGAAGSLTFADDSATSGNVVFVGCSDSIATAVSSATAGDTLVLGSCTYTLASTLNIDKSLSLVCLNGTRLVDGAAFSGSMVNVTASPFSISNCKLEYDSGATAGLIVDARATNVFNYKDVIIDSVSVIGSGAVEIEGIRGKDAGMTVINPQIVLSTSLTGTQQCRTLFTQIESTAEANVEIYAIGGGFHKCSVSSAEANTVNKPLFCWNNGADESANSITCNYENQVVVADNSAADTGYTIAALVEGDRATGNFYGGVLDGGRHGSTSNARDLQTDGGTSVANVYGTILRRGYKVENTGVINTIGVTQGSGIYADNVYQAPDHLAAIPLIDMAGQQGGDKPGTGATAGLTGAGVSMTLGAGGAATEATTTGTGGAGGSFSVTAGAGSDQTIATSTTNVGGAGGSFELTAGAGGAANTAATTNTGGAGGDFYISGGAGGVGTTTNGADGDLILARTSGGTNIGNVGIGTASPVSKLDVSVDGGTTAANAGKLTLSRNDTSVSSLDRIGQIDFWNNDSSLSTQKLYASIVGFADQAITTDAAAGRLAFQTTSTTAGGSPATRMTIRNDGKIGIMTTGPDVALEINSSAGSNLRLTYNDADGSATNYSDFAMSSGGDLTIVASGGDISLGDENLSGTGIYDLGGATLEVPNSTSLPGTCTVGQVYMDTDATTGQRIYACESSNTWALQGDGGGAGGGTKTYSVFSATDNQPPASNFATLDTRNSIAVLDFDTTTEESAIFVGIIPEAASLGSGLIVKISWAATSATSGDCRWGAQIQRNTTDLDSDSFDTATEGTSATNGTSGVITVTSLTLTNIDSVAAGDSYRLKVYRDVGDAADTMAGDAEIVAVEVRSAA